VKTIIDADVTTRYMVDDVEDDNDFSDIHAEWINVRHTPSIKDSSETIPSLTETHRFSVH